MDWMIAPDDEPMYTESMCQTCGSAYYPEDGHYCDDALKTAYEALEELAEMREDCTRALVGIAKMSAVIDEKQAETLKRLAECARIKPLIDRFIESADKAKTMKQWLATPGLLGMAEEIEKGLAEICKP